MDIHYLENVGRTACGVSFSNSVEDDWATRDAVEVTCLTCLDRIGGVGSVALVPNPEGPGVPTTMVKLGRKTGKTAATQDFLERKRAAGCRVEAVKNVSGETTAWQIFEPVLDRPRYADACRKCGHPDLAWRTSIRTDLLSTRRTRATA